jgi:dipeptidyl aminopeptidase/acylaminoacyl peptidase
MWISGLAVSPRGDQVAILEHPIANDKQGHIALVDRAGGKRALTSGLFSLNNVGWSPDANEVWFTAGRLNGLPQQIRAVSTSGKERLLLEVPGGFQMLAVSRLGQLLGSRESTWTEIRARARGAADEADLPAADLSFLSDISDDGSAILGTDEGQGGGENFRFYLQKTDGSPALWLGDGDGQALSPDGRSALAVLIHENPQKLLIVPTGAGETRTLDRGDVVLYTRAVWDPSGRRVVFSGLDKQEVERVYVQDTAGGPPKPVTPDDVGLPRIGRPVSPDGRTVVALGSDSVPALYPVAGGDPRPIPGLGESDVPVAWTPDGRELLVARYQENWPRVERVDVASGRARPWAGLSRLSPTAFFAQARVLVTPDGGSYAYSYTRSLSDLYLTSPLR